jgi:hypothetical protein
MVLPTLRSTYEASLPASLAEAAARSAQDGLGHIAAEARSGARPARPGMAPDLVDETGTTVMYLSGANFNHRACGRISFPDQRWLRFRVRGRTAGIRS